MKVAEILAWVRALDDDPSDLASGVAMFGDEQSRRSDLGFIVLAPRDPRWSRVVLEEDLAHRGTWIGLQVSAEPGTDVDRDRLAQRLGPRTPVAKPIDMHTAAVEQILFRFRLPRHRWLLTILHATAPEDVARVEIRSLVLRRDPGDGLEQGASVRRRRPRSPAR